MNQNLSHSGIYLDGLWMLDWSQMCFQCVASMIVVNHEIGIRLIRVLVKNVELFLDFTTFNVTHNVTLHAESIVTESKSSF